MITRCYNPNQRSYADYGGKGVIVCRFLRESPWSLKELLGVAKKSAPSLDRYPIHDGNYTCGRCGECEANGWNLNVRWATRKQQSENRGNFNVRITAFGKTLLLSQWEALSNIDARKIRGRMKRGWPAEKALGTPDGKGNCYRPDSGSGSGAVNV